MEAGLGQLGFWLMLGMIIAAGTVSSALKERDKERENQATLRALLEKGGQSATEVLAYMRERDGAAAAAVAAMNARFHAGLGRILRRLPALAMGAFAFWGGIAAGTGLRLGPLRGESLLIPLVAMVGIWVAGLTVAWRIWRSAKQKDDAHLAA